jgi:hypothetical protein
MTHQKGSASILLAAARFRKKAKVENESERQHPAGSRLI